MAVPPQLSVGADEYNMGVLSVEFSPSQARSPSSTPHCRHPQIFPFLALLYSTMTPKAQKPAKAPKPRKGPKLQRPPKPPPIAWKTGEQLEFLLAHEDAFKRAQEEKTLDRFWQRVFEEWYHQWELPSSPSLILEYGSIEEGRLMLQKEKNTVRSDHCSRPRHTNLTIF